MTLTSLTAPAQLLARGAAWLIAFGLLTGGFVAAAQTGQIGADAHAALASHLNALIGGVIMLAVAWTLPATGFGETGQARIAWALVVSNYANWILTAVKAFLHVSGVGPNGDHANDAIFGLLNVFVVAPSLVAAFAWAWGLTAKRG